MKIPLVDLRKQHDLLREDLNNLFNDVLDKNNFVLGEYVNNFENDFKNYLNSKYCVGLNSGTAALELGLRALGLGEGDKIATVTNTFIATASSIVNVDADPVFVDSNKNDALINMEQLKELLEKEDIKAVIPVHLYGNVCDMNKLLKLKQDYGFFLIEDCAQAHGAEFEEKKVGTFGDIGSFSFFPAKILGGIGDAGCVITDKEEISEKLYAYRNAGRVKNEKYKHEFIASNHRLMPLQAGVLSLKLKYLDKWIDERRNIAKFYKKELSLNNLNQDNSVYYMYVVLDENRDEIMRKMNEKNIQCGVHYPIPLHLQPAFDFLEHKEHDFVNSEFLCKNVLCIPIYQGMTEEEMKYVSREADAMLDDY